MSTGETWTLGHRPALDGLRGLAVLLVVAAHARLEVFAAGGVVGVTMFFTLSGFLITTLLLAERERAGRIGLGGFYLRRARRLLPALLVFLAGMAGLGVLLPWFAPAAGDFVTVLLYVGNWGPAAGDYLGPINHLWSLSVEEQFYLAWPLFLLFALPRLSRSRLLAVTAAGVVASAGLRFVLWSGPESADRVYYGTDVRADALLVGCLAAIWMHGRLSQPARPRVAVGLLLAAVAFGFTSGPWQWLVLPTVVPWLTAAAILFVARGPYTGGLSASWLTLVGRRSYALYLWHFPLMWWLAPALAMPLPASVALMAVVSWLLTLASWRYVEEPFLRRRPRPVSLPIEPGSRTPVPTSP